MFLRVIFYRIQIKIISLLTILTLDSFPREVTSGYFNNNIYIVTTNFGFRGYDFRILIKEVLCKIKNYLILQKECVKNPIITIFHSNLPLKYKIHIDLNRHRNSWLCMMEPKYSQYLQYTEYSGQLPYLNFWRFL